MKIQSIGSGSAYLKPEEFVDAAALLIEVTGFEPQVPTKFGPKDTVTANITKFANAAEIDADGGTTESGVKIQQTDLARRLKGLVGAGTIVRLEKLAPSAQLPNGAWVWRDVAPELHAKVVAYVERQEAAAEQAVAEMPDFTAA